MKSNVVEQAAGGGEVDVLRPQGLQTGALTVLLGLCIVLTLAWPRAEEDRRAPPGQLFDSSGRQVLMGERLSPVTLVHFWSTWCLPCLEEVPAILRLATDYSSQPNFSLMMIAVADDNEKVATFLGDEVSRSLFDPDWDVAKRYGTSKLPETHLVVEGEIVHSFIGTTNWDTKPVRDQIDEALRTLSI